MSADPSVIGEGEFHPAARSAYRWLKGFMVTNPQDYLQYKEALASAALAGNRQAEICMGTIERLRTSQPVSDRYLLGLCWTILYLHNADAMEAISSARVDMAYPPSSEEIEP